MEYPLLLLQENLIIQNLTFSYFLSSLELLGYEIDSYFYETIYPRITIKIPSNRPDLLSQISLTKEFSYFFEKKKRNKWKILKKLYYLLLIQEYKKSKRFEKKSENYSSYIFSFEETDKKKKNISDWLKKKFQEIGLENKFSNNIKDILQIINFEWGHILDIKILNSFDNSTSLELSKNKLNIIITLKKNIDPKKSIIHHYRFIIQRFLTLIELCTNFRLLKIEKNLTKIDYQNNNNHILVDSNYIKKNKIISLKKLFFFQILGFSEWKINIFKKFSVQIICITKTEIFFLIPFFRNDLIRPIDLLEEYCKFLGYENFLENYSEIKPFIGNNNQKKYQSMIITKNYFLKNNFQEIITSPLKNPLLKKLKNISSFLIPLKNPLNLEFSHLRSTIVESLIFQLEKGRYLKNDHGIKIFETGRIFYQEHINKKKKIFEEEHLGAIFELSPKSINFKSEKEKAINKKYWFLAKSFLENYLKIFGQENIFMLKGIFDKKLEKFYHPEKSITIFKNKTIFGTFGEIHPIFNKKFKNTTFLLELNMSLLKDLNIFSKVPIFQEFSKYPLISRDISFRISKEKNFLIIPSILKNKIPLIKSCIYYDFFFNSNHQDKISASLRIKFQNDKRTLVTSEIDEILEIIYSILREKFEVEI